MKKELTNKDVNRNIVKFYVYEALYGLMLPSVVFTVYALAKGLSFAEIGITEAFFNAVMLVELFGGSFADLIGRRIAIFVFTVVVAVACIMWGSSSGFWGFFVANGVWGLGIAVGAGADRALIYDSLKSVGRAKEFIRVYGRGRMFLLIGGMVGTIVGSHLYEIEKSLPFYAGAVFFVLSGLVFLSCREQKLRLKYDFKAHFEQVKFGLRYLLFHKNVRWVVLLTCFAILFTSFFGMMQSPYLLESGFGIRDVGIIVAVMSAVQALFSYSTEYIHRLFSEKTCFSLIVVGYVVAFVGLSFAYGLNILVFLLVLGFAMSFGVTFSEHYLQMHSTSRIRATVAAAEGCVVDLVCIGWMPLFGKLVDVFSIKSVLFGVSVFAFVCGFFLLRFFPSHRHKFVW